MNNIEKNSTNKQKDVENLKLVILNNNTYYKYLSLHTISFIRYIFELSVTILKPFSYI